MQYSRLPDFILSNKITEVRFDLKLHYDKYNSDLEINMHEVHQKLA